jgi:hypothetical protein
VVVVITDPLGEEEPRTANKPLAWQAARAVSGLQVVVGLWRVCVFLFLC